MIASTTHQDRVTIVEMRASPGTAAYPFDITGHGEAICRLDDAFNPKTGEMIASGRAIQDFGRQIEEVGHSRVVTLEELRRVVRHLLGDA